jgi:hypothetical protein
MTTMNALTMRTLGSNLLGAVAVAVGATLAFTAQADTRPYQGVPEDQAEAITTPDHLTSVVRSGAPTAIWQALEHAEVVECLECIPVVAPLLYDVNARNREIAAWWLRRRIFGVFGPGEVYSQTVSTLASDADPTRRADAASALGEFLVLTGIKPVATALTKDSDPGVRAAAASALGRLNDDGSGGGVPGALSQAFSDSDSTVRAAAYVAAGRINSFTDVASAVAVTGDSDPIVRRVGIELLDTMGASDAADAVLKVAQTDSDHEVRLVACHALGAIGDMSMVAALQDISQNDSNTQVQDQAKIAALRLSR